jgi:CDP-4-dehydro-6-deoxyglucose reductase, E3
MSTVTLSNGKQFECTVEQTILDGARSQGVSLEYSCKTGRCGVCKVQVQSGITKPLKDEICLSAKDQAAGYILTCARTAISDVLLDAEDLGQIGYIKPKIFPCRIDSLTLMSEDVMEVVLRTPPASRLQYLPGQYVDVIGGQSIRRSYSVANAPKDDGNISLHIRRVPSGTLSRYWFDEAKPNDLLRLEGPLGTFCLRPSSMSHLILLATGTGIAPIRAQLEQLASDPTVNTYRSIHLYWGGRTESDMYWEPHFPLLPLSFTPVLSRSPGSTGAKGYVQDAILADGIPLDDSVVYACGSESMIASARKQLIAAGLSPKNFRSDAFVSSK